MMMSMMRAIAGVFVGCCCQVVFLELMVKHDPGAGNLITFAQFVFIALEGFIFTSRLGTVTRIVRLQDYALLVIMFLVTSVCNNYVFSLNIPMPLHMIFRGGSLISNMIMGTIILKRNYRFTQYVSAFMISVGIFLCTYYSSQQQTNTPNSVENYQWILGVLLLAIMLLLSSYMGIRQELMYRDYGNHAKEALYYTHLLPLPSFLLLFEDIVEHFRLAANSEHIHIGFNVTIPIMFMYLLGNMMSQYLCISSVYTLTGICTSLTVTLILTLRKFISLFFSIIYFKNLFTVYHWLGTLLVFVGTLTFSDVVFKRLLKTVKRD